MKYYCHKETRVINDAGIHARPAGLIAKLASKATGKVYMEKEGEAVDASVITDILSLFCPKGTDIIIGISDKADMELLNNIVTLIEKGFS